MPALLTMVRQKCNERSYKIAGQVRRKAWNKIRLCNSRSGSYTPGMAHMKHFLVVQPRRMKSYRLLCT